MTETLSWLELLETRGAIKAAAIKALAAECDEIIAMTVGSIRTLRKRL